MKVDNTRNHFEIRKGGLLHWSISDDNITEIDEIDIAMLAKIGDRFKEKLG